MCTPTTLSSDELCSCLANNPERKTEQELLKEILKEMKVNPFNLFSVLILIRYIYFIFLWIPNSLRPGIMFSNSLYFYLGSKQISVLIVIICTYFYLFCTQTQRIILTTENVWPFTFFFFFFNTKKIVLIGLRSIFFLILNPQFRNNNYVNQFLSLYLKFILSQLVIKSSFLLYQNFC